MAKKQLQGVLQKAIGINKKRTINPYMFYNLRRCHSFKEIAEMVGYSIDGLYHWCRRNGVEVKRITDWEIMEALNNNKSIKEIAFEYNVNAKVVYYRLKKMGTKLRGIK